MLGSSLSSFVIIAALGSSAIAIPTTILQDDPRNNIVYDPELAASTSGNWKRANNVVSPQARPVPRSLRRWGGLFKRDQLSQPVLVEERSERSAPQNLRRWGGLDVANERRFIKRAEVDLSLDSIRRWATAAAGGEDEQDIEKRAKVRTKTLPSGIASRWLPTPEVSTKALPSSAPSPTTSDDAPSSSSTSTPPPSTSSEAPPPQTTSTPSPTSSSSSAKPSQTQSSEPNYGYTSNGYNLAGTHSGPNTCASSFSDCFVQQQQTDSYCAREGYEAGLGACGWYNSDSDYIVAISELIFLTWPGATDNPNDNPVCGKKIRATYAGKSVDVTVVDYCVGCSNPWHLDMSPGAFQQLNTLDNGMMTSSVRLCLSTLSSVADRVRDLQWVWI